jgi:DNA-binding XRE family transcriptional regulator
LAELGHELRRPEADFLRDGIYELMAKKSARTADATRILHRRIYAGKPSRQAQLENARASADVARKIYKLRTDTGLTQKELATLVGTSHSVISRLEDDDYEGHSLAMLRRIAAALNKRVEIRFVALKSRARTA